MIMTWQLLSDRLYIRADSKIWSVPTDHQLFRLDFAPASTGELEISQGDGVITIGQPIVITTDISPIVIDLPLPKLINSSDRRIALKADRTLRLSLSVLNDEPIFDTGVSSYLITRLNEIATRIESLTESLNTMNGSIQNLTLSGKSTIESSTESVIILDASVSRRLASIMNNSGAFLYIDFKSSVSFENYAVRIAPWQYYEMPSSIGTQVSGVWNRVDGSAFVREYS